MAAEPGVEFTRGAAERIAKVVRKVEAGGRNGSAFSPIPRLQELDRRALTLGTFTGSWAINQARAVTIVPGTQTVVVYNYSVNVPALENTSEERFVIFGKVQKHNENILPNSLVEVQLSSDLQTCVNAIGEIAMSSLPGYSGGDVQLLGHDGSACLQWYSVTTCEPSTQTVPDEYGWFY